MESLKVGARVEIIGKNLKGSVAYIGTTQFAAGKWIGVILDAKKGKNNGTVQGKQYFICEDNFGVFVRQHHINVLPHDSGGGDSTRSGLKTPARIIPKNRRRSIKPPGSGSDLSRTPSPSTRTPSKLKTPANTRTASREKQMTEPKEVTQVSPEPPAQPAPEPVQSISLHAGGISMVEYETAKAMAKDWKDKFETIRLKRQEDRAKMIEMEKMRVQLQQLNEWKSRASETQQDLMKQLRDAKKEAKEAVESRDHYIEDMSDVQETIEMATLDKEMAEEKVETLQQEIDLLKEQNEELQTDLEILKADIEESGVDGAASGYQVKQLEEQNSRLKEALVRMRDLSSAEKAEHQKIEKLLEKKEKELDDVNNKKKKLEEELELVESTMDELKEQVDASQMAEEMVETLTDKNLKLEEKLVDLEEQVHDLETMNDMNEELQENARETEMELREAVDLANAKTIEAVRKLEATTDIMGDYEDTIKKFRKLVQELQEANEMLRSEQSSTEQSPETVVPPPINYQIKMVETKAAARSIDLELRKMEANLANDHVRYLSLFMPAIYNRQGGDSDCVQMLLLVERVETKSSVLGKHIADRFDVNVEVNEAGEMRGLRGEQITFANRLINQLVTLSILMKKYKLNLNLCSVELLQKIGTLYSEMTLYERPLDQQAELLRTDALDETTNTNNLDKAIAFFQHLYTVHLSKMDMDCWYMMDHHILQCQNLLQSISFNCSRVKAFLKDGHQTSDIALLLKDIGTAVSDVTQFCKKLRRRMPSPPTNTQLTMKFDEKIAASIAETAESMIKLDKILYQLVSKCSSLGSGAALPYNELQSVLQKDVSQLYNYENVYNSVRMSLGSMMATMNSLVTCMQEGEFDSNQAISKIIPPVEKRAEIMKSNITTSESLTFKMDEKDAQIGELKRLLKSKADDVGECKIRIGMLERKLEIAGREGEEVKSRLQQEIDTLKDEAKKKEKEYDDTLDALQADIDMLEGEKAELKKRLVAQSKRSALDYASPQSPASSIASVLAGAAASTGSVPGTQVVVEDSPLLKEQIRALQVALKATRMKNCKLMGQQLLKRFNNLTPLESRKSVTPDAKLLISLNKVNHELVKMTASPRVIDISQRKPGTVPVGRNDPAQKLLLQHQHIQLMQDKVRQLKEQVHKHLAQQEVGGVIKADFTSFPTMQFVKSLKHSTTPVQVGSLTLPKDGKTDYSKVLRESDIELHPRQLRSLHDRMLNLCTPVLT